MAGAGRRCRYQAALGAGDAEAIVSTFAPDGYFREPISPDGLLAAARVYDDVEAPAEHPSGAGARRHASMTFPVVSRW